MPLGVITILSRFNLNLPNRRLVSYQALSGCNRYQVLLRVVCYRETCPKLWGRLRSLPGLSVLITVRGSARPGICVCDRYA